MKRLPDDDPRHLRALELRREGYSQREIMHEIGIGTGTLGRWLAGVPRGRLEPESKAEPVMVPAPFARGYRYFNTRW